MFTRGYDLDFDPPYGRGSKTCDPKWVVLPQNRIPLLLTPQPYLFAAGCLSELSSRGNRVLAEHFLAVHEARRSTGAFGPAGGRLVFFGASKGWVT